MIVEAVTPLDVAETALAMHVEQIVAGNVKCDYCDNAAVWMLASGADPELIPHCNAHFASMARALETMPSSWADTPFEAAHT